MSSRFHFCPIPINFNKLDFYFNLIKNILKLLFLLWSSCYIQVCCLISRYLGIFQLSFFYNFYFNPIVVWEHTLYAWYHLNLDVIYNTDCGPACWLFQVRLWNYILLLEKKVLYMSIRSCWFIVLFNQLYSYFLLLDIAITERGMLICPFLFQFY